MKTINLTSIIILSFLFTATLSAQTFLDKLGSGINFDVKTPQGSLSDNGMTNYYGGSLELFYVGCSDKTIRFTPGYRIGGGLTQSVTGNTVLLAEPAGATATETLRNAFVEFQLVGRVIYDKGHRIRPYGEVYFGPRVSLGYETLALTEEIEGFTNATEELFSKVSTTTGLGIGALVQLSDAVDLNIKVATEYTGQINHSELSQQAYSLEPVRSYNAFNNSFTIGLTLRPRCGRSYDRAPKRSFRRTRCQNRRPNWNKALAKPKRVIRS